MFPFKGRHGVFAGRNSKGELSMNLEGYEDGSQDMDDRPGPPRKVQVVEVLVFLFLIVPTLALSFTVTDESTLGFSSLAAATLLRDLALVSLVLYFLWRNGEPMVRIGWTSKGLGREIALGSGLFVPFFIGSGYLADLLANSVFSGPSKPLPSNLMPNGTGELALAFCLVVVVALAEETIFRGYLILRFHTATGSTTAAVLLSAFVFTLGHGYEGPARVFTVGIMGVILALVYLWRKSLVAPIVMHFLQDFIALVAAPLLKSLH
jgi:membrane protease YdiL (CAAX protease family)